MTKKTTETEAIDPVIVADVTPAEPVAQNVSAPLLPEEPAPDDPFADSEEPRGSQELQDAEPVPPEESDIPETDSVAGGLVLKTQEKLDKRNAELEDMKSMLTILEERNDDPERIALYKQLIAKTEKEISGLKNDLDRYKNTRQE